MQLVYFKTASGNFGDDLNLEIWPALAPRLFEDPDPATGFVGIGTVIGLPRIDNPRIEIFSTGAGYEDVSQWSGQRVTFHCVRGPLTARLCGLDSDVALTDGAVLTPLVPGFPQTATGGGGTVVIPHYESIECGGWEAACEQAGLRLVDPRRSPREVIGEIAGADRVITESLHGAILADTYGVPWQAIATTGNFSTAKWVDWTASVGQDLEIATIPPPNPRLLLRVGRPASGFDTFRRFSVEDAMRDFGRRTVAAPPSPRWRSLARKVVTEFSPLQGLLGFSPSRTAAALTRIAGRDPAQSAPGSRDGLRDRLLSRLQALEASVA